MSRTSGRSQTIGWFCSHTRATRKLILHSKKTESLESLCLPRSSNPFLVSYDIQILNGYVPLVQNLDGVSSLSASSLSTPTTPSPHPIHHYSQCPIFSPHILHSRPHFNNLYPIAVTIVIPICRTNSLFFGLSILLPKPNPFQKNTSPPIPLN